MSKPKQALTWQQLKDFANALAEEKLSCKVVVWGDDRGFSIQGQETFTEEYRTTDEGCEPTAILEQNLEEGQTIDDYPVAYTVGDPILYTDMHEG